MSVTLTLTVEVQPGYGAENPLEPAATGPWLTSRVAAWQHVVVHIDGRSARSPGFVPADAESAQAHKEGLLEMAHYAESLEELIEIGWLETYDN